MLGGTHTPRVSQGLNPSKASLGENPFQLQTQGTCLTTYTQHRGRHTHTQGELGFESEQSESWQKGPFDFRGLGLGLIKPSSGGPLWITNQDSGVEGGGWGLGLGLIKPSPDGLFWIANQDSGVEEGGWGLGSGLIKPSSGGRKSWGYEERTLAAEFSVREPCLTKNIFFEFLALLHFVRS